MRTVILLLTLAVAACNAAPPTAPAGQVSTTNVNPETGSRGGSGAGSK